MNTFNRKIKEEYDLSQIENPNEKLNAIKKKKKKYVNTGKPLNDFQRALKEETDKIDGLIGEIDENAIDIKNEIEIGMDELAKLDRMKNPRLKHIVPGERIQHVLREM